ncbi:hypothetical protein [Paenibacillus motobuensis]|uniref:Uncharacterized protein n=1 Tax=Paenibacillus motobuensis TaxID=295324 RepID=A0ABP3HYH1_9BACL
MEIIRETKDLEGSCYIEVLPGKYLGQFITDYDKNIEKLRELIKEFQTWIQEQLKNQDYISVTKYLCCGLRPRSQEAASDEEDSANNPARLSTPDPALCALRLSGS